MQKPNILSIMPDDHAAHATSSTWDRLGYGWNFDYLGYTTANPGVGWGTKIMNVPDYEEP